MVAKISWYLRLIACSLCRTSPCSDTLLPTPGPSGARRFVVHLVVGCQSRGGLWQRRVAVIVRVAWGTSDEYRLLRGDQVKVPIAWVHADRPHVSGAHGLIFLMVSGGF